MPQAKGVYGIVAAQYESVFGTDPGTPDMTKLHFESEGFKASQNLIASATMTGNRFATAPIQGNIDVTGSLAVELGAYPGMLLHAAAGSIKTEANSGAGETLGAALTTPTATLDAFNQIITVASTAHGLVIGDTVKFEGLTAPTSLNNLYCRVVSVPTVDSFVCRLPLGISGTFTLGAGTVKKVTAAATTYKHTIKFGGKLPSLVVEKGFTDIGQYFKYNGCVCSKLSLAATPEGFQKLSFDFSGQKETVGTNSFDSTATDLGKASFSGFHIGTIEEGGNPIASVTKVDVSIDNGLDTGVYVIGGQGLRGAIPEGMVKVSGTVEALFADTTLYTKAINGTESSLNLVFSLGAGAGTAGNESLEIKIPELIFKRDAPTIGGDKGVLVSLPFEAYLANAAEATSAQIILKNTQLAI